MLGWRRFVFVGLLGFCGGLALLGLFVLLMNPYGNLPPLLFREHVVMDGNQRYQYPALIRSGRFDSAVIGTSAVRLLRPDALARVFGGHFVNLGMDAASAWEQYRIADLFIREAPARRTLLVGLEQTWCYDDDKALHQTLMGFPRWMYDDSVWNDLPNMLNGQSVRIAFARLANVLGLQAPAFSADGYKVFLPPDSDYDPAKVRRKLWGKGGSSHVIAAATPAFDLSESERAQLNFPGLVWLEEIASRFNGRVVLVFMPAHVTMQPTPASAEAAREEECKARVASIARRRGAALIDFRIASSITSKDDNYWDRRHYRVAIAARIIDDIEQALLTGKNDPNGDWRYLAGPEAVTTGISQ